MAIDLNDEIVQDFLIEAHEILEHLNEQLLQLESSPDNTDLLNAVFRSFHTIKGGAGFLGIEALVNVCHIAENVFDLLRNGQRKVDTLLMDSVLEVLDVVNDMFQAIRQGQDPENAPEALMIRLETLSQPQAEESTGKQPEAASVAVPEAEDSPIDDMDDRSGAPGPEEEITDEEFERLLDDLHGKGKQASDNVTPIKPRQAESASVLPVDDVLPDGQAAGTQDIAPGNADITSGENLRQTLKSDATVRVETSVLDSIMNMVGELVLLRNRLSNLGESLANEEVSATVSNLDVVTTDLQASVMKTRMQPIKKVFGRFPRLVRDLARNMNKEIMLDMIGEDTDLDKNLVEALSDPLIHLVRNSVDHGIELPEEREAAGKPRQGMITLSAEQEGDHILLSISDDGKGMDYEELRKKVVSKGLLDEDAAARLNESECYNLIFLPGFSTRDEISDVSGRGVGMDVVKSRINHLNGIVNIESAVGVGTTIYIKVPLTLAIMPTLMVGLGEQQQIFALPLVNVNEILEVDEDRINTVDGSHVVIVRGKPVPLFNLSRWLSVGHGRDGYRGGHLVIVSIGTRNIALYVDSLIGREEVVIKPLGALLNGTRGLAGATITGNGHIALILDLPDLVQVYAGRY